MAQVVVSGEKKVLTDKGWVNVSDAPSQFQPKPTGIAGSTTAGGVPISATSSTKNEQTGVTTVIQYDARGKEIGRENKAAPVPTETPKYNTPTVERTFNPETGMTEEVIRGDLSRWQLNPTNDGYSATLNAHGFIAPQSSREYYFESGAVQGKLITTVDPKTGEKIVTKEPMEETRDAQGNVIGWTTSETSMANRRADAFNEENEVGVQQRQELIANQPSFLGFTYQEQFGKSWVTPFGNLWIEKPDPNTFYPIIPEQKMASQIHEMNVMHFSVGAPLEVVAVASAFTVAGAAATGLVTVAPVAVPVVSFARGLAGAAGIIYSGKVAWDMGNQIGSTIKGDVVNPREVSTTFGAGLGIAALGLGGQLTRMASIQTHIEDARRIANLQQEELGQPKASVKSSEGYPLETTKLPSGKEKVEGRLDITQAQSSDKAVMDNFLREQNLGIQIIDSGGTPERIFSMKEVRVGAQGTNEISGDILQAQRVAGAGFTGEGQFADVFVRGAGKNVRYNLGVTYEQKILDAGYTPKGIDELLWGAHNFRVKYAEVSNKASFSPMSTVQSFSTPSGKEGIFNTITAGMTRNGPVSSVGTFKVIAPDTTTFDYLQSTQNMAFIKGKSGGTEYEGFVKMGFPEIKDLANEINFEMPKVGKHTPWPKYEAAVPKNNLPVPVTDRTVQEQVNKFSQQTGGGTAQSVGGRAYDKYATKTQTAYDVKHYDAFSFVGSEAGVVIPKMPAMAQFEPVKVGMRMLTPSPIIFNMQHRKIGEIPVIIENMGSKTAISPKVAFSATDTNLQNRMRGPTDIIGLKLNMKSDEMIELPITDLTQIQVQTQIPVQPQQVIIPIPVPPFPPVTVDITPPRPEPPAPITGWMPNFAMNPFPAGMQQRAFVGRVSKRRYTPSLLGIDLSRGKKFKPISDETSFTGLEPFRLIGEEIRTAPRHHKRKKK